MVGVSNTRTFPKRVESIKTGCPPMKAFFKVQLTAVGHPAASRASPSSQSVYSPPVTSALPLTVEWFKTELETSPFSVILPDGG